LSYKKDVADMRESPSLKIKEILEKDYKTNLNIFDPYFINKSTHNNLDEFLKDCEALVIATNHSMFTDIDFSNYKNIKVIVD
jgi:UDP-N-acetyl-D-mannosaminuronic acid dehydrogenase